MIIKPPISGRIFWGAAGVTLLITGCSISALAFPVGLLLLCIALPLAVCSFAFGAVQTRVDEEGVFQRNFFFMTKKFAWHEIDSGKIQTASYNRTDSSGWTSRGTRTYIAFIRDGKNININSGDAGPENWWVEMNKMAKERLRERFEE